MLTSYLDYWFYEFPDIEMAQLSHCSNQCIQKTVYETALKQLGVTLSST